MASTSLLDQRQREQFDSRVPPSPAWGSSPLYLISMQVDLMPESQYERNPHGFTDPRLLFGLDAAQTLLRTLEPTPSNLSRAFPPIRSTPHFSEYSRRVETVERARHHCANDSPSCVRFCWEPRSNRPRFSKQSPYSGPSGVTIWPLWQP